MKKIFVAILTVAAANCAFAAGFGLYENSARANSVGGHVVAKAVDASAVYYNPATMSGLTGTWITVGATCLHPMYDYRVRNEGGLYEGSKMTSGYFILPHVFITQELPKGFHVGLGMFADYGLGSQYNDKWALGWDTQKTLIEAYTVQPTVSYQITEKWAVAGGVRLTRFNFRQSRYYDFDSLASRLSSPYAGRLGQMRLKLKAHNDVDVGLTFGTSYQLFDNFSLGLMWRSPIRCDVSGSASSHGDGLLGGSGSMSQQKNCGVQDYLDLPQSAVFGFQWDVTDDFRFMSSVMWTEWSSIDKFEFGEGMEFDLGWHDAFRVGFGMEYDICDWCMFGIGYTYDWDPSKDKPGYWTTMLPSGDRHNIFFGPTFMFGNWELAVSGGVVRMESKSAYFDNPLQDNSSINMRNHSDRYYFKTRNSNTAMVAVSLTFHF